MSKEELELYDMVLNSKKSFDINYKELAISLREELKETKERIDKAIEHIEKHQLVYQSQYEEMSGFDNHLLDILRGNDNE